MIGVILFTLCIFIYGFVLATDVFAKAIPQAKGFFSQVDRFLDNGTVRVIFAVAGILIGLWNFFAPDFGAMYSPTIIGALIPSLLIIFDSTVLYPNIIEMLNIPKESKDQYYAFIEKFRGLAGIVTLASGLLHILLFKQILF